MSSHFLERDSVENICTYINVQKKLEVLSFHVGLYPHERHHSLLVNYNLLMV